MPCVLEQKRADKATQASTLFSPACPTCLFQFKTMQVIESKTRQFIKSFFDHLNGKLFHESVNFTIYLPICLQIA